MDNSIQQIALDTQLLVASVSQVKKLMNLQGDMALKLIESAKVPNPQPGSLEPGLGANVDIFA